MTPDDKKEILQAIHHIDQKFEVVDERFEEVLSAMHTYSEAMDRRFDAMDHRFVHFEGALGTFKAQTVHHREVDLLIDRLEIKKILTPRDVKDIRAVGAAS